MVGIIPALAGNTRTYPARTCLDWDHPRACGEHQGTSPLNRLSRGSSPRLRRTRPVHRGGPSQREIIPALAGNTAAAVRQNMIFWDHPRACGEHEVATLVECERPGIIPALAGNTIVSVARGNRTRDHPRACGEHPEWSTSTDTELGSSPRLRGTLVHCCGGEHNLGIIPALAGNTCRTSWAGQTCRDHPRACGERVGASAYDCRLTGSSPRLRGTHFAKMVADFLTGIIPALAGNTLRKPSRRSSKRDHPRACGEHGSHGLLVLVLGGSSPRLRGTLPCTVSVWGIFGIIPALAGNTAGRVGSFAA